ncbi:hypothetical protein IKR55_01495 [bacterium]|nr:hypothetical protein [bacterium]
MTFSYLSIPSIPYVYGNILPGGWANFSGQTHVFTVDPDDYCFNPEFGLNFNALNMLNQVGYGNYNIYMGGLTPPPYQGAPQPQMPDPAQVQSIVDAILAPIREQMNAQANQQANQNIQACDNAITASKPKLEAMLQDENLSEEDKAKVQEALDKVNEAEEKLKAIKDNQDKISPQEAQSKTEKIRTELIKLINDAAKIGTQNVGNQTKDNDKAKDDNNVDDNKKVDDETATEKQGVASHTGFSSQVQKDTYNFFGAVSGLGTDEDTVKEFMGSMDKDNVMDRMCAYNKYKSKVFGESLMEAFVGDVSGKQRKEGCKNVASALQQKADELGIYDECAEDFAAIDRQLSSFWGVNDSIYEHFNNIVAKIGEKMGGIYAQNCEPKEKA